MRLPRALILAPVALLGACTVPTEGRRASRSAITSVQASILDFRFSTSVVASSDAVARDAITAQLRYAQGALKHGSRASGQVGRVMLSEVVETVEADKKRIQYTASLPVAWPNDTEAPSAYELALPADVTALDAFDGKYDGTCGRHSADASDFWHDFNPRADGCSLDDADVVRTNATASSESTFEGAKYPEYDRIWADDRLDVVAIFGIIRGQESNDWGFTEAHRFADDALGRLDGARVEERERTSSILEDKSLTGRIVLGGRPRDVSVDVLVVDSIEDAGGDFDARYDELSGTADLLLFSGHARHGRNINALVRKGRVTAGRYQLMLLNGCESFALADTTVTDRRRDANGNADPTGTRFVDVITNAQPGQSDTLASISRVVYDAALALDQPLTYDAMIRQMPERNVVVVYGEEDNAFSP